MTYRSLILCSIIISLLIGMIIGFLLLDIVAGITTFAAVLVAIQFITTSYENRVDAKVEVYTDKSGFNNQKIIVRITNTGGKVIYLKEGGIETDDKTFINFDEDPNLKDVCNLKSLSPLIRSLNTGDSKDLIMNNHAIKLALKNKNYQIKDQFRFKGKYIDKIAKEYLSEESLTFSSKDFFKI